MTMLVTGILLWSLGHMFKRLAPGLRQRLGPAGRGLVALALLAGLVLMVLGYRAAPFEPVYQPVAGMGHLNNLLMLVAIYLFGVGKAGSVLRDRIRHPMLSGVVLWALAHLLVNGDLASIALFGGLGLWALLEMALINRAEPWQRPPPGSLRGDAVAAVVTVALYGIIAGIHAALGHPVFLGSYG